MMNTNVDLKELLEAVFIQIDAMKKVILTWVFRGEPRTNDPEGEWAGEMLKIAAGE